MKIIKYFRVRDVIRKNFGYVTSYIIPRNFPRKRTKETAIIVLERSRLLPSFCAYDKNYNAPQNEKTEKRDSYIKISKENKAITSDEHGKLESSCDEKE